MENKHLKCCEGDLCNKGEHTYAPVVISYGKACIILIETSVYISLLLKLPCTKNNNNYGKSPELAYRRRFTGNVLSECLSH